MGFFQNCAHLTLGFWQHTIAAKNARSHPNDHLSSAFEVFSSQDEKRNGKRVKCQVWNRELGWDEMTLEMVSILREYDLPSWELTYPL